MTSVIWINVGYYREISRCGDCYEGSYDFDEKYGMRWIKMLEDEMVLKTGSFKFEVVDQRRYLVAKLKYGI